MLADLPGYGYAAAPKHEIIRWTGLIERYLRGRASLRRVLVLIDARFGIKDTDRPVMTLLDKAAVSFQAVLTKADAVKQAELERLLPLVAKTLATHPAAHPTIHITSSREGEGLAALRATLVALAEAPRPR
jgi:GTP-binding protein